MTLPDNDISNISPQTDRKKALLKTLLCVPHGNSRLNNSVSIYFVHEAMSKFKSIWKKGVDFFFTFPLGGVTHPSIPVAAPGGE